MKMILPLLLAGFSAAAQNTNQQHIIQPGDPTIRYDWIKPAHDFYRNTVTDSAGNTRYDFVMEDFTIIDSVKKQIVFARYRQVPRGSFSTDTSVTDLFLKPVSMHELHFQRDVSFEMSFGDELASVRTIRKGVASVKTYPMKRGYFEDNMIEYIFGWLELKKGVTYSLDDFNKDTPSPSNAYTLEYAFDDPWILGAGSKIDCRVIRFVHGSNTGYIWVDKASHQVLKEEGSFDGLMYVMTKV
jgi:hypothetical protein